MGTNNTGVRRRRRPSLIGPVLIITIGVILLLSYLDVLSVSFWQLWRLWPLLIILIGVDILFGRRSGLGNVIVLLVTLAVVAGLVVVLVASPNILGSASRSVEQVEEPLGDAERAELTLDLPAGTLILGGLEDSPALIDGSLEVTKGHEPRWDVDRTQGVVRVTLDGGNDSGRWTLGGDEWDLGASPLVGLSVDAEVGAGKAEIDLTGLDIRDFKLQAGAGQIEVTFPETGDFAVEIDGGVGRLELVIPESMAARLQIDRGLSSLSADSRFERHGDVYRTDDWDTNPNKVDVRLKIGLGLLSVR